MGSLAQARQDTLQPRSLADRVAARQTINQTALLLDVSGSMAGLIGVESSRTKAQALTGVLTDLKLTCPRIVFGTLDGDGVRELATGEPVPGPEGGTPLAQAIQLATRRGFQRLVVISDGQPDSPPAALEAAQAFGKRIDVFYVGPVGGPGLAFLGQLAQTCGGAINQTDLQEPQQLTAGLRGLLEAGR